MSQERRLHHRRKIYVTCQVEYGDRMASGKIVDASESGIGILLPDSGDLIKGGARVHIPPAHQMEGGLAETIVLGVRPVNIQQKSKGHRLGFKIVLVETGEADWALLWREISRGTEQSTG